jgi:hypothetical protein
VLIKVFPLDIGRLSWNLCAGQSDFSRMEQEQPSTAAELQREMVLQVVMPLYRQAQSTIGVQEYAWGLSRNRIQLRVRKLSRYFLSRKLTEHRTATATMVLQRSQLWLRCLCLLRFGRNTSFRCHLRPELPFGKLASCLASRI